MAINYTQLWNTSKWSLHRWSSHIEQYLVGVRTGGSSLPSSFALAYKKAQYMMCNCVASFQDMTCGPLCLDNVEAMKEYGHPSASTLDLWTVICNILISFVNATHPVIVIINNSGNRYWHHWQLTPNVLDVMFVGWILSRLPPQACGCFMSGVNGWNHCNDVVVDSS